MNDDIKKYIDEKIEEVISEKMEKAIEKAIEEVMLNKEISINNTIKNNINQHAKGRYPEVRDKVLKDFRECKEVKMPYKSYEALREFARIDAGIRSIKTADQYDLDNLADLFEVMAEAYLKHKKCIHEGK